ncbi:MAG: tetratricopeptide repeat protein [Tannerellaceae bacterium]|jgi:tetratricopeptide (TPR) repeat protein|nr:tetratricopeptide repeat protein [Tannerellaceae bacterium]
MQHRKITIGWIFALAFCTIGVYAQKAERKNVRDGNKLYTNEKYTEAEVAYRKSLEVNPRSIEGTYNLGDALYKQQKYPEAAEQYQLLAGQGEKLLQDDPGNSQRLAHVYHNLGNIGMQNKEYAKSVEAYKQSLRLNPRDNETRYNLALAQKLLEDQQNEDQSQNDQNQDDQQQDQQQEQQQDQQQQQNDQQENKTQEEQQQNEQMSQDNAQQILDAFLQDEKDTQEKVKKAQAEQQQRRKTDKEW